MKNIYWNFNFLFKYIIQTIYLWRIFSYSCQSFAQKSITFCILLHSVELFPRIDSDIQCSPLLLISNSIVTNVWISVFIYSVSAFLIENTEFLLPPTPIDTSIGWLFALCLIIVCAFPSFILHWSCHFIAVLVYALISLFTYLLFQKEIFLDSMHPLL